MSKWFHIAFLFFLLFLSEKIFADNTEQENYEQSQLDSSSLKEANWKNISKNYDYQKSEEEKKKEEEKKVENNSSEKEESKKSKPWIDFNSTASKTVLISIVVISILTVVLILIRRSRWVFNKKVEDQKQLIQRLEENLPDNDLDPHIRQALKDGDYRLAFRLYYLLLIQKLIHRDHVKWKKEKTNGEYLIECLTRKYYTEFAGITLCFDQVWYGEYFISKSFFEEQEQHFKNIFHEIESS
ncbi:MAG TPA: hypothetical protein DCQ93_01420 [Bacteroidetes bacterium]|nr:hypothetical protein [Bacteroidota bacterium]